MPAPCPCHPIPIAPARTTGEKSALRTEPSGQQNEGARNVPALVVMDVDEGLDQRPPPSPGALATPQAPSCKGPGCSRFKPLTIASKEQRRACPRTTNPNRRSLPNWRET